MFHGSNSHSEGQFKQQSNWNVEGTFWVATFIMEAFEKNVLLHHLGTNGSL
jgi:hypothetical protein